MKRNLATPSFGTRSGAQAQDELGFKYTILHRSRSATMFFMKKGCSDEYFRSFTRTGHDSVTMLILIGLPAADGPFEKVVQNMGTCF